MNRRDFASALAAAGLSANVLFPAIAGAQPAAAPLVEGKDFLPVQPPQPVPAGKIEVLEFFSYACPHCSAFEPNLEAWATQLPADVLLRRVPVPFLMNAENFQRTYYALETMGAVNTLQLKIFRAIHIDRQRLEKPEDIAAFVGKNGGNEANFMAAFKSFSNAASVARAKKLTADYKIDGVPSIVIQGRFLTSPSIAGGGVQALTVTDQLIQRVRKG